MIALAVACLSILVVTWIYAGYPLVLTALSGSGRGLGGGPPSRYRSR